MLVTSRLRMYVALSCSARCTVVQRRDYGALDSPDMYFACPEKERKRTYQHRETRIPKCENEVHEATYEKEGRVGVDTRWACAPSLCMCGNRRVFRLWTIWKHEATHNNEMTNVLGSRKHVRGKPRGWGCNSTVLSTMRAKP